MDDGPQQPAADEPEALLERAGAGDREALLALYDRFSSQLFAVALRVVGSVGEAEDVLQDALVRAWREAPSFDRSRGSAGAWLVALTRNRAIDVLRARRRRDEHTSEHRINLSVSAEEASSPEVEVSEAERARDARTALDCLSKDQRTVLELAYYAGLSHSEIAAKLGQPLGTVKTRILAATRKLREALGVHKP